VRSGYSLIDPDARLKLTQKLSTDPLFCSLFTAAADSQEALKVIRLCGLDVSMDEIILERLGEQLGWEQRIARLRWML
jgi:hypothetical protein